MCGGSLLISTGADGACRFPDFLYPVQRGRRQTYTWTTEARYPSGSRVADTELEVTVRDGNTLVTKLRHVGGICDFKHANVTCLHREFRPLRLENGRPRTRLKTGPGTGPRSNGD